MNANVSRVHVTCDEGFNVVDRFASQGGKNRWNVL